MIGSKDDVRVVGFMVLYAKLRDWTDDDPSALTDLSAKDESVRNLCVSVAEAATQLFQSENRMRSLFAEPVDPEFLKAWRDYEARYSFVLAGIWLADAFGIDVVDDLDAPRKQQEDVFERREELARSEAQEAARNIQMVFNFAKDEIGEDAYDWPEGFVEDIESGIAAWERLTGEADIDVEGIIRRRRLVPFVLIPRHVSRHHGSAEKFSLFTHLQQAQEAFVYGIPFASIALLRSILEVTLRDHYHATGSNLEEYIGSARLLPANIRPILHKLRKLANHIVHFNKGQIDLPQDMEKQILIYLYTLRALIEGAPTIPAAGAGGHVSLRRG